MMTVGIPKFYQPVSRQILDAIHTFEMTTGCRAHRLAVSSYLLSRLYEEELVFIPYGKIIEESKFGPKTFPLRRVFGLPCFCVAENDVIMVSV